jgi:hypothetical protein
MADVDAKLARGEVPDSVSADELEEQLGLRG